MKRVLRNIILFLVLANVLLLAWKRWVVPPDVAWPERLGSSVEPQLVLVNTGKPADNSGKSAAGRADGQPDRPVSKAVPTPPQCGRIGPFVESATADSIAQQLGNRGFSVSRTSEQGDVWVGYWVQLLDLENEQEARRTVDRLVKAGLLDTYIVQTEPTYNISLGVFRGRKGADRVRDLARGLGMNPQTMDRFRTGTQHWIIVRYVEGKTLDLQDIQLDTRQILRTEDVPCAPDGAVDPGPAAG